MADLSHCWGGDLAVSANGDLLTVDGLGLGQQRILRRLATNPGPAGDYLWNPAYGAGLPGQVGGTLNLPQIKALIRGQVLLEQGIAQTPLPTVNVTPSNSGMVVGIAYAASDGQQVNLAFEITSLPVTGNA